MDLRAWRWRRGAGLHRPSSALGRSLLVRAAGNSGVRRVSPVANTVVSILFDGLAYAMFLFIISVGLSVTMGLMGFVNLAHGAFAMAGGYVMTTLMNRAGVPFPLALMAAVAAVVAASFVLEWLLYRRLYGASELDQVLLTIGLIFMTVGAATYFWG